MKSFKLTSLLIALVLVAPFASTAHQAAPSRGTIVAYPNVFDGTGTNTSRSKTIDSVEEIFKKGGFTLSSDSAATAAWKKLKYRTPTMMSPPTQAQLVKFGKALKVKYVASTKLNFHTRSIWVNLGPKTISTCTAHVTIVDTATNKIVYDREGTGRSDEKSDVLKIAGALLISPLVTAVSGGPKTPQETRAGQIAVAVALNDFIVAPQ